MVTASQTVHLQVGPLSCDVVGADVRDLRVGSRRVVTRLYIAVRDDKWNTIPFSWTTRVVDTNDDDVVVTMSCLVDTAPISVEWTVRIMVRADGRFDYEMAGDTLSEFDYAKIGLNVHHPLPETLGSRYIAHRADHGVQGRIPALIDPQLFVDGKLTGMFTPYERLTLESGADDRVTFTFTGDEFEMQDHRNWTDYNLKTYGTPLEVPLPLHAMKGDRIEQAVSIDLQGLQVFQIGHSFASPEWHRLDVDRTRILQRPRIGTEYPDEYGRLAPEVGSLVRALGIDYVRVNLDLTDQTEPAAAQEKAQDVRDWALPLELTLVVSAGEPRADELAHLRAWLATVVPCLERVVVLEGPRGFAIGRTTTPTETVRRYRSVVEGFASVPCVSATEQFFAELNRWWPDPAGVDGFGFTICPQVHAADDTSVMENSWGQADTVVTARARSGGYPVHVTSIAMIGKFGPYPGGVPAGGPRPSCGDPRQHQLFGAAWTVSSVRQLVAAHAASATFFELFGDRGIMQENDAVSGAIRVDAVYRVLEEVLSWPESAFIDIRAAEGAPVVGLGAEWPDRGAVLLANLSAAPVPVKLYGLIGAEAQIATLTDIPHESATWVTAAEKELAEGHGEGLSLTLDSFGVARVWTR